MSGDVRICGRCEEEYESYTFFVTDHFVGLVDKVEIEREYGNVCQECRRELADGQFWGVLEA